MPLLTSKLVSPLICFSQLRYPSSCLLWEHWATKKNQTTKLWGRYYHMSGPEAHWTSPDRERQSHPGQQQKGWAWNALAHKSSCLNRYHMSREQPVGCGRFICLGESRRCSGLREPLLTSSHECSLPLLLEVVQRRAEWRFTEWWQSRTCLKPSAWSYSLKWLPERKGAISLNPSYL